jgi:hypothetical protein
MASSSSPDLGLGNGRGEMYKAEHALDELMEYSQLGPGRWKATYRGFVTLSAQGRDPKNAQFNLDETFDLFLANLIRTSHRSQKAESDVFVHETEAAPIRHAPKRLKQPR